MICPNSHVSPSRSRLGNLEKSIWKWDKENLILNMSNQHDYAEGFFDDLITHLLHVGSKSSSTEFAVEKWNLNSKKKLLPEKSSRFDSKKHWPAEIQDVLQRYEG